MTRITREELARLTPAEHVVLGLMLEGNGPADIAYHLGVKLSTARVHTRSILTKLGVRSQLAAVCGVYEMRERAR